MGQRSTAWDHWGRVDEDLLFDAERYGLYASAHHLAGHHWALRREGMPLAPAGLRPPTGALRLGPSALAPFEATAVLAEALAIEAVVCAIHGEGFGLDHEVDQDSLDQHIWAALADARERGCVPSEAVDYLLAAPGWRGRTTARLLSAWPGIAGLADALGHGRVLEGDEVAEALDLGVPGW